MVYAAATPIGPQEIPMLNAGMSITVPKTLYQKFLAVLPQVIITLEQILAAGIANAATAKILKMGADSIHFSPNIKRTKLLENIMK